MGGWGDVFTPGQRLSFAEFMELSLYHDSLGYYAKAGDRHPIGPEGDFVTAPTIHEAFVATLATVLQELATRCHARLTLVDVGAGDGSFLRGLGLHAAGTSLGRLVAVERSPAGRAMILQTSPGVEVVAEIAQAQPPTDPCVVFASELYDAMPFHVVEQAGECLKELYVEVKPDGTLGWRAGTPSTPELANYLAGAGVVLEPGQRAEVRLQAENFHRRLLAWAGDNALVLVIDYGYPAKTLYNPKARFAGSLVGYQKQRLVRDVLRHPGQIDLTAHVNWDDLVRAGESLGFSTLPPEPLGLFLTRWGLLDSWAKAENPKIPPEVKVLVNPAGMGSDLKLLVQGRGELWATYLALNDERRP